MYIWRLFFIPIYTNVLYYINMYYFLPMQYELCYASEQFPYPSENFENIAWIWLKKKPFTQDLTM